MIAEGAVNGVSIGFDRLGGGPPTDDEVRLYGPVDFVTRAWRWLELSVTPMPCNPDEQRRFTCIATESVDSPACIDATRGT